MTLTRLRTRAYAAGLAAVLALAGCGDPEGVNGPAATAGGTGPASSIAATPAASATPTTTAEVDPVLARIPAAARPETSAGAEAFTRFFIGKVNEAWSVPSSAAMAGLFAADCKVCVAFSDSAERMASEGRRHKGDTLTVTRVSTISFTQDAKEVRVEATQNALPVLNPAGKQVDTTKPDAGSFVLTLVFTDHWIVQRMQAVKE